MLANQVIKFYFLQKKYIYIYIIIIIIIKFCRDLGSVTKTNPALLG